MPRKKWPPPMQATGGVLGGNAVKFQAQALRHWQSVLRAGRCAQGYPSNLRDSRDCYFCVAIVTLDRHPEWDGILPSVWYRTSRQEGFFDDPFKLAVARAALIARSTPEPLEPLAGPGPGG